MIETLKKHYFSSIRIYVALEIVSSIHALATHGRHGKANREKIAYFLTVAKFDRTAWKLGLSTCL